MGKSARLSDGKSYERARTVSCNSVNPYCSLCIIWMLPHPCALSVREDDIAVSQLLEKAVELLFEGRNIPMDNNCSACIDSWRDKVLIFLQDNNLHVALEDCWCEPTRDSACEAVIIHRILPRKRRRILP